MTSLEIKDLQKLDVVALNRRTWKAEAGGSLQIQEQPGLYNELSELLSQKTK